MCILKHFLATSQYIFKMWKEKCNTKAANVISGRQLQTSPVDHIIVSYQTVCSILTWSGPWFCFISCARYCCCCSCFCCCDCRSFTCTSSVGSGGCSRDCGGRTVSAAINTNFVIETSWGHTHTWDLVCVFTDESYRSVTYQFLSQFLKWSTREIFCSAWNIGWLRADVYTMFSDFLISFIVTTILVTIWGIRINPRRPITYDTLCNIYILKSTFRKHVNVCII